MKKHKLQRVVFYCSGCQKRVTRMARPKQRYYLSFCASADHVVRMRRSRDQSLVSSHTGTSEIY